MHFLLYGHAILLYARAFWLYTIATLDLTKKQRTARSHKQQHYGGLRYLFCNNILQSIEKKSTFIGVFASLNRMFNLSMNENNHTIDHSLFV